MVMEDLYHVPSFFCSPSVEELMKGDCEVAQEAAQYGGLSASPGGALFVATIASSADRSHRQSRPVGRFPLAASVRGRRFVGFVAAQGRRRVSSGVDLSGGAKPARSRLQVHALDRGFAGRTFASQNTRRSCRRDGVEDAQTSGLSLWPTEARSEISSKPQRSCPCQTAKTKRFKKTKSRNGTVAFIYCDEAELHLNPGLSRCWSARGKRVIVPLAGQNRRVPVFGALDAMTGEVSAMVTDKKRSGEFLQFLDWLINKIYADKKHVYLFLDNCSIHHTKAVRKFLDDHRESVTVIWNATYAPNLNLIERLWGNLKRTAIHNYYFQTVEILEDAIIQAVHTINRNRNHPIRMHLQTEQTLRKAA